MIKFTLEGERALFRSLKRMGSKVIRNGLPASVAAGAQPVEDEIRARAPVDEGVLRDSISTEIVSDGRVSTAVIGPDTSEAPYAPHVEHGTRHMSPQPFVAPGFDAAERESFNQLKNKLGKEVDKAS
jgi:HK97 gp10 family phage protein